MYSTVKIGLAHKNTFLTLQYPIYSLAFSPEIQHVFSAVKSIWFQIDNQ